MRVITAPNDEAVSTHTRTLFLSGGITGASDWQSEFIEMLRDTYLTVYNPRLVDFDERVANAHDQIEWEFVRLRGADAISFWFPEEAACMITLHELGQWLPYRLQSNGSVGFKALFIGAHPKYARQLDVEIQSGLARPGIQIAQSLYELAEMVRTWSDTTYL